MDEGICNKMKKSADKQQTVADPRLHKSEIKVYFLLRVLL